MSPSTPTAEPLQEPLLLIDESMDTGLRVRAGCGRCVAFTNPRPGREGPNQDAAAVIPVGTNGLVLAVADGVGGGPSGDKAASLAVRALSESVTASTDTDTALREAVLDGFEHANERIRAHGAGAATTMAAVSVDGGVIRTYHAGDSSVLVVGQRGKLKLLTTDHSPVGYAVEAGLIDQNEALQHEDRYLVNNVVGDGEMRIELGPELELKPRDTLLLASDGLFDNLYNDEIIAQIRSGPLTAASASLVKVCLERMSATEGEQPSKADDLTFILFRMR